MSLRLAFDTAGPPGDPVHGGAAATAYVLPPAVRAGLGDLDADGVGGARYGLGMTPETARSIMKHLVDRTNFESGSDLSNVAFGADRNPGWADPWFARIALLVGDVDRIEYATGVIVPDHERRAVLGDLVVFTATQIVTASFTADSNTGYLHPIGTVASRPRSAVRSVAVNEVARLAGRSGQEWPDYVSVTVMFNDDVVLDLPMRRHLARGADHDLVSFLPGLLVS